MACTTVYEVQDPAKNQYLGTRCTLECTLCDICTHTIVCDEDGQFEQEYGIHKGRAEMCKELHNGQQCNTIRFKDTTELGFCSKCLQRVLAWRKPRPEKQDWRSQPSPLQSSTSHPLAVHTTTLQSTSAQPSNSQTSYPLIHAAPSVLQQLVSQMSSLRLWTS